MPSVEQLDEAVVVLQCFEPAGGRIEMTMRDLLGHTLVLGATGTGKTSAVVNPILRDLVRVGGDETEEQVALIIVDLKGDRELKNLLAGWVTPSARLKVVSAQSAYWIDPFEPMRTRGLAGLDSTVQRIAAGVPVVQSNAYWHTVFFSIIRQTLSILWLSNPEFAVDEAVDLLGKQLLAGNADAEISRRLDEIESRIDSSDKTLRRTFENLERTQAMWRSLDPKTKSNFLSMGATVVDPLLSEAVINTCRGEEADRISIPQIVEAGDVLLLQMDGFADAEAASFVSKMIKSDFYELLAGRQGLTVRPERLAGLIVDEWSMIATGGGGIRHSDTAALQMIRSKGGFVVAASQSMAAIDLRMGFTEARAAIANFNNLFVLRSREEELERAAMRWFGRKRVRTGSPGPSGIDETFGDVAFFGPIQAEIEIPVIRSGDLPRLEVGQCFAAVGSNVHPDPLWLVPIHGSPER